MIVLHKNDPIKDPKMSDKKENDARIRSNVISIKDKKELLKSLGKEKETLKYLKCEHCGSDKVISHGNYKNRKRYKCQACKKTFNDLTSTLLNRIREKEKFEIYIHYLSKGLSVRKAAKKVKISSMTSFLWRKKILSAIKKIGIDKTFNE